MTSATAKARNLRKAQTDAERVLWQQLRNRQLSGAKFKRQYGMGRYIVDFICLESKLIVEVDGGQHAEQHEYDAQRTAWLEAQGFKVLRFWNNEVLSETAVVLEVIMRELLNFNPSPQPSPLEGERE
jgi:very-short-patch-repair endonuclease